MARTIDDKVLIGRTSHFMGVFDPATGRYTLEVFAQNLGNETGILDYGNSGSQLQRGYAVFTAPRTVGVQFGAKF
jgi:hypothetical protein